jgi:hypothetical protein
MLCVGCAAALSLDHEGRGGLDWVTAAVAVGVLGPLLVVCAWTSELSIRGEEIVARHFFGTRRMVLAEVIDADAGVLFGLVLKDIHNRKMWTLVSGRQWNELWLTRAERICTAIMAYAESARRQQEIAPAGNDEAVHRAAKLDRFEIAYHRAWADATGRHPGSTETLLRDAFKSEHVPGIYTEPEPALITLWMNAWRQGLEPDRAAASVRAALRSAT